MTLISRELRQAVIERARGKCEYCQLPQATQVATFPVDHVIAVAVGGLTEFDNLALACPRCNAAKWTHIFAFDSESGQPVQLFNPRSDQWTNHFRWSANDPTWLESRTPTGRATTGLLDLNSQHRRQVRRWLIVLGLHPPDTTFETT